MSHSLDDKRVDPCHGEADSRPIDADLRPFLDEVGLTRRRQGPRPTCSVFTVNGALEYAMARASGKGRRLSVEYLNWAGHRTADRTADGGFFHELWNGYREHGICSEEDWPYRTEYDPDAEPPSSALQSAKQSDCPGLSLQWIKEWNPDTGLEDRHLREIEAALDNGWPVCGGFRWPHRPVWEDGVLGLCAPEEVFDGHSVLLVGYRRNESQPGGGLFLIRNSGGDGSDGALSYEYVRRYMNDAAWIQCDPSVRK